MAPAGQYQVQEAPTGRAKCQACKEKIEKGALRLGVLIEHADYPGWIKWRHWECVTDRVVTNMEHPSNLEGLADLPQEYQDMVHATFGKPPPPKPRKQKAKAATKENDENEEGAPAVAAPAGGKKGKGKGKRGGAALGDTVDAEVALPAPTEQLDVEEDPLEYVREDLGAMLAVMLGGELSEALSPHFEGKGPRPAPLSVLIRTLQEVGVLVNPWPTPAHEAQLRAKWQAAQAAAAAAQEAAAAAAAAASAPKKKRAARKARTRRPRGYDSDEDWP